MPRWYLCPAPSCGRRHDRKGLCEEHRRERDRRRNAAEPHRSVYRDRRARPFRAAVWERDGWRCVHVDEFGERCGHVDETGKTLHAHHHPLSVRELLARGLDPFDPDTAVTLCKSHHSEVEARMRYGSETARFPRRRP